MIARHARRVPPKRKLTLVVVNKIKTLLVESSGVLTLHHIQHHLEQSGLRLCRQTISQAVTWSQPQGGALGGEWLR